MDPTLLLILVVVFAVLFDMANGWNDAANAIATVVGTRVLTPSVAIFLGALFNFLGALVSSEVAKTVGRDIADPTLVTPATHLAAVLVAPVWITFCTLRGLPISCSHALMGALVGSVIASAGVDALEGAGIRKIVFGVFVSPVAGFLSGMALVSAIGWICRRVKPSTAKPVFGKLQLVSAMGMAFAHGTGDAQKAMGIITGALLATEALDPSKGFHIPLWVRLTCAVAMGLGTLVGGWRVMRTLGSRITELRTYQGFAAETAAAATILANTLTGVPISTTHSITGAVMGVGAAHGARSVRWGIGKKIVYAWVFTFPVCIVAGGLCFWLLRVLGVG